MTEHMGRAEKPLISAFWEDEKVVGMILSEFGLDPENGHIINGHTPSKQRRAKAP